jgi:ABC-2 type transport system permease protein
MRKIFAIAWKDTILRFSSVSEWLFFLILPIAFTLILAGGTRQDGDSRIRLGVADLANSPLSADLIAALDRSEAVRPDKITLAKAEEELDARQVTAILIIPAEFDLAHLQQGKVTLELRQQPNDLNASIAERAVLSANSRISSAVDVARGSVAEAERIAPFASESARGAYFNTALKAAQAEMSAAPDRIQTVLGAAAKDQIEYDPRANTSAGQLITWVFIPLLGISGAFAYERQQGTLRRLLTTPTGTATYLIGTIAGQVVMALLQMLLLVGFGILVMGLKWGNAPAALAVMLVASALAAAALGTTLGTFVKTEGQASGLSVMLGMVMALLGGCWYPIELFPAFVQTAVKVLPTSWAMQGMLDIVLRGQGLSAVLPEAGVLLGFAVVFFAVGVWRFKYE